MIKNDFAFETAQRKVGQASRLPRPLTALEQPPSADALAGQARRLPYFN